MSIDAKKGRVSVGLIEMNELDLFFKMLWLILVVVLTGLTITANLHPSLKMRDLAWQVIVNNFYQIESLSTGALSLRLGHRGEDLPAQLRLCRHLCRNHPGHIPLLHQNLGAILGGWGKR